MSVRVLIIGTATDGPETVVALPRDERDLLRLYGGSYTQRFTLTATGSVVDLDYTPHLLPTNSLNGVNGYLYSPMVSGQSVIFGSVGGSGATLDLTYSPYRGKSDLLWSARHFLSTTNIMPYVARVPGTRATLEIDNWKFSARHHGQKYNNVTVSYSASGTFTVGGLEPNFPTITYSDLSPLDLRKFIERNFELGISPIFIEKYADTLPVFSATLTGGLDGEFTTSTFQQIMDGITFPVDCSHVIFLVPASGSLLQDVTNHLIEENVQPRLFIFQAPDYDTTTDEYLFRLSTDLSVRNPLISLVVGTVQEELDSVVRERYAVEAVGEVIASTNGDNLTNQSVPALSFYPELSADELSDLKDVGAMAITRHIRSGICVYKATNSAGLTSYIYSSKVAEIASIVYKNLISYIGRVLPDGPHPQMSDELQRQLSSIELVTINSVECYFLGGVIMVNIDALLPDEILQITFSVKNII